MFEGCGSADPMKGHTVSASVPDASPAVVTVPGSQQTRNEMMDVEWDLKAFMSDTPSESTVRGVEALLLSCLKGGREGIHKQLLDKAWVMPSGCSVLLLRVEVTVTRKLKLNLSYRIKKKIWGSSKL